MCDTSDTLFICYWSNSILKMAKKNTLVNFTINKIYIYIYNISNNKFASHKIAALTPDTDKISYKLKKIKYNLK